MFCDVEIMRPEIGALPTSTFILPPISVFFCEFVTTVTMCTSNVLIFPSAFFGAILHIVFICADEKVSWVDARRVVASMADVKWAVDRKSIKKMCDHAMHQALAAFKSTQSVAAFIFETLKNPTTFWGNFKLNIHEWFEHGAEYNMPRRLVCPH
jgi:uncharacterized membrane protein YqaE (UPF0057 family)